MKHEISIVNFDSKVPLTISFLQFDSVPRHMHSSAQLLINISGESTISQDNVSFTLKKNDMIIVNPRNYHSLLSKSVSTMISVLIDLKGFGLDEEESSNLSFSLNSVLTPDNPRINPIRFLVYSLIKYNTLENINSIYTNRAIAFSFFAQLINDFKTTSSEKKTVNLSSIAALTSYVESHYAEGITLNALAEKFGYAVPYVSRLFKQSLGKNFLEYYDELRVNYSMSELLDEKNSIESISKKYGFENPRSFVRAFRKIYGMYPSEYRDRERRHGMSKAMGDDEFRKKTLDTIIQSLDEYNESTGNKKESTRNASFVLSCDASKTSPSFINPSNQIATIDGPGSLFVGNMMERLGQMKKDIGFKILRVNNIMSGDFPYLYEMNGNTKRLNHQSFQKIAKTILGLGYYPYFEFEYNPKEMALQEFEELIRDIVSLLYSEYKESKTRHWRIAITSKTIDRRFLNTWASLLSFIRQNTDFKVVSPTFDFEHIQKGGVFEEYKSLNIKADFTAISLLREGSSSILDKNALMALQKKASDDNLWPENKVIITNSMFSSSKRNLLFDTSFASSFLAMETILSIGNIAAFTFPIHSSFGVWNFEDSIFDGHRSLFENDMKKASYQCLSLLSKLGNELIAKGKNYLYTRSEKGLSILFNNYLHYSDLFAKNQYYELSKYDRYRCFAKGANESIHLDISGLPCRRVELKITSLGTESGSAYDAWVEMGSPEDMGEDEMETLKAASRMKFTKKKIDVVHGSINVEFSVSPHEVKLLEIAYLN